MRITFLDETGEAADDCFIKLIINGIHVLVGESSKYPSGESIKSSYRDVLLGFAADLWRLYPFIPRGAQSRLSDTNLDHASMCSRPGPRAHWSAVDTACDVTARQASRSEKPRETNNP